MNDCADEIKMGCGCPLRVESGHRSGKQRMPVARWHCSFTIRCQPGGRVPAGHIARVSDDFRTLTGREPERYRDWLLANKAALLSA